MLIAGVLFVAVAGASFGFLRHSQPAPTTKPPSAGAESKPKADAEAVEKPDTADAQRGILLENVGSVSSIQLYQSYLNVGMLADAVENETYTKQDAGEVLATIAAFLQTVDRQMEKLEQIGLEKEDMDSIKRIRDVSKLLRSQTQDLQTHWQTGDKAAFASFHEARQQSWQQLQVILGFNDKSQKGTETAAR